MYIHWYNTLGIYSFNYVSDIFSVMDFDGNWLSDGLDCALPKNTLMPSQMNTRRLPFHQIYI